MNLSTILGAGEFNKDGDRPWKIDNHGDLEMLEGAAPPTQAELAELEIVATKKLRCKEIEKLADEMRLDAEVDDDVNTQRRALLMERKTLKSEIQTHFDNRRK